MGLGNGGGAGLGDGSGDGKDSPIDLENRDPHEINDHLKVRHNNTQRSYNEYFIPWNFIGF
jgi:hypothetical protein